MAQVLATGVGADAATVWLRSSHGFHPGATWPSDAIAEDAVPTDAIEVRHQDEVLGAVGPHAERSDGTREGAADPRPRRAGRARAAQRRVDRRPTSRIRLVAAQNEERRRIERNIHDGAQQQLVALAVKLRLTDTLVGRDEARAHALLAELQTETNQALEDLRDLARGIYPPLLADRGLGAALRARRGSPSVPVTVDVDGIGRYAQEAEAAVYFSCLEALQNVAKYADASSASVRLRQTNGSSRSRSSTTGRASTRRPPSAAPGSRGSPTGSPRSAAASTSGARRARATLVGTIPVEAR